MRRLEQKGDQTCVFSADDKVDEELEDAQIEDDELWGLPQFLDEDELMNDTENLEVPTISRVQSTNSDSTCHSDFGNQNATSVNLIDGFLG